MIRELGYPFRAVLNRSLDESNSDPSSRRKTGKLKPKIINKKKKKKAVIELCLRKSSANKIAEDVGVSRQLLYKWKDQLLSRNHVMQKNERVKKGTDSDIDKIENELTLLKRVMHDLQLEHNILKKANELLKKDHGISHQKLTNREKTILIDALLPRYRLNLLLDQVGIPRSSYFYHRARLNVPDKYCTTREILRNIFINNRQCYGYRRIRASLIKSGVFIAEKVIRRLMKEESLVAFSSRKKRNYSSYCGELSTAADNIIQRNFNANKPNEKWLTDITDLRIASGKAYLSPVIDCFDVLVVSWTIGTRPTAELVNTMLDQAISVLKPDEQPIIHSDRGGHYRWPGWIKRMASANLKRSMSRKGCSPDNAACEAFFGKLKTEFFYPTDWSNKSIEELIEEIDSYIMWYNQKRIKISLDSKSPMEYRESLGYAA